MKLSGNQLVAQIKQDQSQQLFTCKLWQVEKKWWIESDKQLVLDSCDFYCKCSYIICDMERKNGKII